MTSSENIDQTNKRSKKITIISFTIAFLIILIIAIGIATAASTLINSLVGLSVFSELLVGYAPGFSQAFEETSKGILFNLAAASIFSFFPPIQKRIEFFLAKRNDLPIDKILSPTKSTKRLLIYGITLSVGTYSALILFTSLVLMLVTYLEIDFGLSLATTFAVALILVSAYPIAMYLIGEWIGRSSTSKRSAVFVAFASSIALGIAIWFLQRSVAALLADGIRQDLGMLLDPETDVFLSRIVGWWAIINGALIFLTVLSPLIVSAFRGAKYKMFYDLAYFYHRLPQVKKAEMIEYVQIIDEEFERANPSSAV